MNEPNRIDRFRDTDEQTLWVEVVQRSVPGSADSAVAVKFADEVVEAYRERMGDGPR